MQPSMSSDASGLAEKANNWEWQSCYFFKMSYIISTGCNCLKKKKNQPHYLLSKTLCHSWTPGWRLCWFCSFQNKSSADRASPSAQDWHLCQLNSFEIDFSGIYLRILRFPGGFYTLELLRWFVWYQHPAGPLFWHNHVKCVNTSSRSRTNSFVHSFNFYSSIR